MDAATLIAIIALCLIGAMFWWALDRRHPEDAEREAFDRMAEDRANADGFAQPPLDRGTAKIDLGTWRDIVRPPFASTRPETNTERAERYRRAAAASRRESP